MDDLNQGPPTGWKDRDSTPHWAGKLALPTRRGLVLIGFEQIVRLEADSCYTTLHLLGLKPIVASKGLGELHAQLPAHQFVRCHHKHVVNMRMVQEAIIDGGYRLLLANGESLEVSRRRWAGLMEAIKRM